MKRQFNTSTYSGLISVPIKKMVDYNGIKIIIHRPTRDGIVQETHWVASEYRTGRAIGSIARTMADALAGAKELIDQRTVAATLDRINSIIAEGGLFNE